MIRGRLRRLLQLGNEVLGINARNLDLVYPHNPRAYFFEVDDKLVTKEILARHAVPTPRSLAVVARFGDLRHVPRTLERIGEGFVIKPARASGGDGILVVQRAEDGRLFAAERLGDRVLEPDDVVEHLAQILSGLHQPSQARERAFLEELLEPEQILGALAFRGLPDIRVVLHRRHPVMAMLRIPTRESAGRANLHQGALGAGIDLRTGRTTHAIVRNRSVERHPDTSAPLRGIPVPGWKEVLDLARRASQAVRLGYVGVDLCIDRRHGPLVIEINARPGLNIQIANRIGLRTVLGQPA